MKIKTYEQVELWLTDNQVYRKVKDNIRAQNYPSPFTVEDIYTHLPLDEKINLLSSSFMFDDTKEGEDFWFDINLKFKLWYVGNIKGMNKLCDLFAMRDALKYVYEKSTDELVIDINKQEYYRILEEIHKLEI